jgi:hypothetical protein
MPAMAAGTQGTPTQQQQEQRGTKRSTPSPGYKKVRQVELPKEPDMIGLKLAGYDQLYVDTIKCRTDWPKTGELHTLMHHLSLLYQVYWCSTKGGGGQ